MLKIQRSGDGEVVFKLSGRIDKENVAELQALIGAEVAGKHMVLDLKNVILVGQCQCRLKIPQFAPIENSPLSPVEISPGADRL